MGIKSKGSRIVYFTFSIAVALYMVDHQWDFSYG